MNVAFGTDGVRAPWNPDNLVGDGYITPEIGFKVGAAAVESLGIDRWVMVRDTRPFNQELARAVMDGVASRGGMTIDVGVLPTPAAAFISSSLSGEGNHLYGAISLSASHNPVRDAGIKVMGPKGTKLTKDQTEFLQFHANELSPPSVGVHQLNQTSIYKLEYLRNLYIESLLDTVDRDLGRNFLAGKDVVVDAANGAAYWSAPEVLRRLGANVILINGDPNGEINKDCGATHTESMVEAVLNSQANYGMALDGDADRLIAYSRRGNRGRLLDGDDAVAIAISWLAARDLLKARQTVVTDYSSVGFELEMRRRRVKVKYVENGDRYVAEGLMKTNAIVGTEKSGHTLFAKNSGGQKIVLPGDGTLTALRELQTEVLLDTPLVDLSGWPILGYARADIPVDPGVNSKVLIASSAFKSAIQVYSKLVGDDGLVLVRGSGTEPVVRLLVKTGGEQRLADEIVSDLAALLKKVA